MNIEWLNLAVIKPYEKNNRIHSQEQIQNIAESIKKSLRNHLLIQGMAKVIKTQCIHHKANWWY